LIAGAFHRTGAVEVWGRGTNRVIAMCRKHEAAPPIFEERQGFLIVTFKAQMVAGGTAGTSRSESGKSSLFDAMDIFIDEKKVPEADDCCVHAKDNTIRIACVFDSLPKQLVIDERHPTDLASEYLLNPDGNLEVAKVYTCPGKGKGKLKGIFARANHPTAENYSELLSLTNATWSLSRWAATTWTYGCRGSRGSTGRSFTSWTGIPSRP
jgi:hypothetical protein